MRIEEVKRTMNEEVIEKVAKYTKDDIERLIIKDLEKNGIKGNEIIFNTCYKIERDEWGMNPYTRTFLSGVTVKIE